MVGGDILGSFAVSSCSATNPTTDMKMLRFAALAASLAAVAPATRLHAQSKLDDPTIVAIFDAANTWDIETAKLGEQKGTTKDVRDLAAMFARDHANVRQQGRDLAKKLGVTPTPPKDFALAKDHAAAMKKLEGLSGKAFDKAFLENEVAYHKAVIDAMTTTLLPALKNAEVKDLVTKVAPAFQAHMAAAQNLLDKQGK
jgi:putative membrane protein